LSILSLSKQAGGRPYAVKGRILRVRCHVMFPPQLGNEEIGNEKM